MTRARRGRGRLSAIELLPPEASDIVVWAARELAERSRTLTDIYAEFRDRLIALQGEQGLAFDIPAFSSFHRHSVRQAELARRLEETREISSQLAARLDGVGNEDLTVMVIEALKTLIFEIVSSRGAEGASPKEAMEMARAVQSLVGASRLSVAQRASFQQQLAAAADEAIDKAAVVAREAGVSAAAIAQMRREFLGVRPKPEAAA
ncbi:phage protein Gp27 family protein [Devosia sp.]|jgi:hypothetical protein|uniref:phage protein Gp27 family protein n=1 Tax=Devosia sp. TaxID=1871048 RepID=UPI0037C01CF2